jgi:putative redox protein
VTDVEGPDGARPLVAQSSSDDGDGLRQNVLIDGRHELTCDEPVALGGSDAGPTPHELVPAALAACTAVTIRTYARRRGMKLGRLSVEAALEPKSLPPRIRVNITTSEALAPDEVQTLARVASACPVKKTLLSGELAIDCAINDAATEPS